MAGSTSLTRTPSSTGNQKTFTISFWMKRSGLGADMQVIGQQASNYFRIIIKAANDALRCYGPSFDLASKRELRDTLGWYHIVLAMDTTQATDSNRAKLWINGIQETTFDTETYPSQNADMDFNHQQLHKIGSGTSSDFYDGLLSHIHFCDGTAYTASDFGSTDATSGEWTIKTSPSVTYGTNGFRILKDDNTITDQSSNSNDWALGAGTLTSTQDCPDDTFCTMNPHRRFAANLALTQGNLTCTESAGSWQISSGTLGATKGKYYCEYKITTLGTGSGYHKLGICGDEVGTQASVSHGAETALDGAYVFYFQNGSLEARTDGAVISGWDASSTGITCAVNDVMCMAVDMDNKFMYFRKNGDSWAKSGDPTSGASGTGGVNFSADYPSDNIKFAIPTISIYSNGVGSANFGDGSFGTTAISSAGTNASAIGIFEYDVPTGYTAWSTKGLQE